MCQHNNKLRELCQHNDSLIISKCGVWFLENRLVELAGVNANYNWTLSQMHYTKLKLLRSMHYNHSHLVAKHWKSMISEKLGNSWKHLSKILCIFDWGLMIIVPRVCCKLVLLLILRISRKTTETRDVMVMQHNSVGMLHFVQCQNRDFLSELCGIMLSSHLLFQNISSLGSLLDLTSL